MLTVVASYRQNVHAYPSGGGDYEVATVNLGPRFGLAVASALLVDYVLTVAVSIASGVANLGSVVPWVAEHKVAISVIAIFILTSMNLRGVRESGAAFAIPTYGFMIVIIGMVLTGLFRIFVLGDDLRAPSAGLTISGEHAGAMSQVAMVIPAAAHVLLRLRRADRRRGHLQRRARLQARRARTPRPRCCCSAASRSPCSSASWCWPG